MGHKSTFFSLPPPFACPRLTLGSPPIIPGKYSSASQLWPPGHSLSSSALAAIGEPWVRALVVTTFLALAIHHHWRKVSEGKAPGDVIMVRRLPLPLLGVALAIGVRLAAKWAVYQHLTWMII
ncbi:hypothetical protein SAY87_030435 [Trapa incisa]|uniref:Uncharacterized protein n=1 Tax=Trapa incisa TaxID=236973 RepID=A0AAN7KIL3_9MYRT|nr:hypothetical protein SAY87_030435 [Trapa incisa]